MTHSAVLLILDALATFRLTRLVLSDSIMQPLRSPIVLDGHGPPWLAELLTCPWCMSVWMAAGIVVAQATIPGVWFYVSAVLAFSAVAGLLEAHA